MNSESSKTTDPHKLLLKFSYSISENTFNVLGGDATSFPILLFFFNSSPAYSSSRFSGDKKFKVTDQSFVNRVEF